MPHRILVPTDFSPASEMALGAATELAQETRATLLLLHVRRGRSEASASDGQEREAALDHLAAAAASVAPHVPVRTIMVEPSEPAPAILRAADGADLVVAAAHSGTGDQPGLGRTAAEVAEHARCPVLFVAPAADGGLRVRVAIDLSESSAAAVRAARQIVGARGGVVEAVHAVPDEVAAALWGGEPIEASDDLPAERQLHRLRRFVAAVAGPEVRIVLHLAEGARAEAVERLARDPSEPPASPATH